MTREDPVEKTTDNTDVKEQPVETITDAQETDPPVETDRRNFDF